MVAAETLENVPRGQLMHAAVPLSSLYAPAGHAMHAPPSGPVKPGSHSQSDAAVLPAGPAELGAQLVHSVRLLDVE